MLGPFSKITAWGLQIGCIFAEPAVMETLVTVLEFQTSLAAKHRAKSIRDVGLLAEFGTNLREPHVKAVKGEQYKGLWELRTKCAGDISRIFYFLHVGNRFVLLHGYVKKDDKLEDRE